MQVDKNWRKNVMTVHSYNEDLRFAFAYDIDQSLYSTTSGVGVGDTLNANAISVSKLQAECKDLSWNSQGRRLYYCSSSRTQEIINLSGYMSSYQS